MRYDGRRKIMHYMGTKPEYVALLKKHVGPDSEFYKELSELGFDMKSLHVLIRRPHNEAVPVE